VIRVDKIRPGSAGEEVCRPSPLGNPFSHRPSRLPVTMVASRSEAIARYRAWLAERLTDPSSPQSREVERLLRLYRSAGSLALLCWCAPLPCHAEVVREVLLARSSAPEL
jgi:hypothetical protein